MKIRDLFHPPYDGFRREPSPVWGVGGKGCYRRSAAYGGRCREGPLTDPIADAQACRWELVKIAPKPTPMMTLTNEGRAPKATFDLHGGHLDGTSAQVVGGRSCAEGPRTGPLLGTGAHRRWLARQLEAMAGVCQLISAHPQH